MKKISKLIKTITVLGCVALSAVSVFADSNKVVKVKIGSTMANVDGKDVQIEVAPYIQKDTNSTMIPLRFVSNALGIDDDDIEFDANTKTITIEKDDNVVKFFVNNSKYILNNSTKNTNNIKLPKVEIKDGRTFVPFRTLAEAFDLEIKWDANTKTAIMSEKEHDKNDDDKKKYTEDNNDDVDLNKVELKVVELVNEERAKNGLSQLTVDEKLMKLSREKSEDMKEKDYFSHTSPTYGSPFDMMKQNGVKYKNAAENIAKGQQTAEEVVLDWLNSEGHRANILNPSFTKIGVGLYGDLWTQLFIG